MTNDSIGLGKTGLPTSRFEHLADMRAIPKHALFALGRGRNGGVMGTGSTHRTGPDRAGAHRQNVPNALPRQRTINPCAHGALRIGRSQGRGRVCRYLPQDTSRDSGSRPKKLDERGHRVAGVLGEASLELCMAQQAATAKGVIGNATRSRSDRGGGCVRLGFIAVVGTTAD